MISRKAADTRELKRAIEYVRVSTRQQGRSGLGLEAQREAIQRFCEVERFRIVESFVEVESAKGDTLTHRPKLLAALKAAKRLKDDDYRAAPIVVAKLDRLSRDVHFICGLWRSACPSSALILDATPIPFSCTSTRRSLRKSAE